MMITDMEGPAAHLQAEVQLRPPRAVRLLQAHPVVLHPAVHQVPVLRNLRDQQTRTAVQPALLPVQVALQAQIPVREEQAAQLQEVQQQLVQQPELV